jgi:hypothetical protein
MTDERRAMRIPPTFEFLVGILVAKILLAALFSSPLSRNIAVAAAAIGLCVLYAQDGSAAILSFAQRLQTDLLLRPDFSKGLALGAIISFAIFGFVRRRISP